jgi:hypothetical protein
MPCAVQSDDSDQDSKFALHKQRKSALTAGAAASVAAGKGKPVLTGAAAARAAALGGHKDWRANTPADVEREERERKDLLKPNPNHAHLKPAKPAAGGIAIAPAAAPRKNREYEDDGV